MNIIKLKVINQKVGVSGIVTIERGDLTNYYTKQEIDEKNFLTEHQDISTLATKTLVATKQDKLVSGTNIATINNQDITKGGNIVINEGLIDQENRVLYLDTVKDYEDMVAAELITEPNVTYIAETGQIKYYKKVMHKMICEVTLAYKELPVLLTMFSKFGEEIPIMITMQNGLLILTINSIRIDDLELTPKEIDLSGVDTFYLPIPEKYKRGGEFEIVYDYTIPINILNSDSIVVAASIALLAPVKLVFIDDYSINNVLVNNPKLGSFILFDMYILPGYTTDVYLNFKEKHLFSLYSFLKSELGFSYSPINFHLVNYDSSIYGTAADKDSILDTTSQGSIYGLLEYCKNLKNPIPFTIIEE